MLSALRPELCRRLVAAFGRVVVANEGEEMRAGVETDPETGRLRLVVNWPGEYYRVCCPFCWDTKYRLWINHRWALYVPELRSDNLFLAHCYNEDCLARPGRARVLRDAVFNDFIRGRDRDAVLRGRAPPVFPPGVRPAGEVDTLQFLPNDHPAKLYLRSRGYDPDWLGREFHVGYCSSSYEFPAAERRIIIPILRGGLLMGWQARYVGDPPDHRVPKYLTMTGMRKSEFLYNYDAARRSPYVVVCEGAGDVWALGPEAVALLGRKVSGEQARLIAATWDTVVVMLDGDAPDEAREVYDALGGRVRQRVIVTLPPDTDPGDYDPGPLRDFVFAAALEQGVSLGPPGATPGASLGAAGGCGGSGAEGT
jgi:hypothetical protein